MKYLLMLRTWWHQEVLDGLAALSAQQSIAQKSQQQAMGELWLKLAQFWQQNYIDAKPPAEWPVVGEVGMISCPICQNSYKVDDKIPTTSKRATVVCSNTACGESMEVYPDNYYGWLKPRVEYRERSYK
jgi:uncharacterized protein YbaR (Trm112 family)